MEKMVTKGQELLNELRNNDCVTFKFVKANGDERVANGTLKKEVFESMGMGFDKYDKTLAQSVNNPNDNIVYWDLDCEAFRTCTVGRLV